MTSEAWVIVVICVGVAIVAVAVCAELLRQKLRERKQQRPTAAPARAAVAASRWHPMPGGDRLELDGPHTFVIRLDTRQGVAHPYKLVSPEGTDLMVAAVDHLAELCQAGERVAAERERFVYRRTLLKMDRG
jgi:hypothetical protein